MKKKTRELLRKAKEVLQIEAEGILGLIDKLDEDFAKAVEIILRAEGRVIVTGVGKSGIIGRKIVATLNSTGTPALFLHPVEAMHGDLGMVTQKDVILAISNSGETGEITILIPSFKRLKAPLIALTGNPASTLAKHSDVVINTGVKREACPLGLAPTASTTATLAMGDALAVVLLEERKFGPEDFKRFHPGGNLGRKLSLKAKDVMRPVEELSLTTPKTKIIKIISLITQTEIVWVAKKKRLKGMIDQQVKAKLILEDRTKLKSLCSEDIMIPAEVISADVSAYDALDLMREKKSNALGVIDKKGYFIGAVFLQDLLNKASFSFS
jgi:arabinose-5-phosphate isomerase